MFNWLKKKLGSKKSRRGRRVMKFVNPEHLHNYGDRTKYKKFKKQKHYNYAPGVNLPEKIKGKKVKHWRLVYVGYNYSSYVPIFYKRKRRKTRH